MSLRSSVPDPLVGPARRVRDAVRDATAGQRSGWAASRRRRRVEAKVDAPTPPSGETRVSAAVCATPRLAVGLRGRWDVTEVLVLQGVDAVERADLFLVELRGAAPATATLTTVVHLIARARAAGVPVALWSTEAALHEWDPEALEALLADTERREGIRLYVDDEARATQWAEVSGLPTAFLPPAAAPEIHAPRHVGRLAHREEGIALVAGERPDVATYAPAPADRLDARVVRSIDDLPGDRPVLGHYRAVAATGGYPGLAWSVVEAAMAGTSIVVDSATAPLLPARLRPHVTLADDEEALRLDVIARLWQDEVVEREALVAARAARAGDTLGHRAHVIEQDAAITGAHVCRDVSLVVSTNRAHELDNVTENVLRQAEHANGTVQLVLVLHGLDLDPAAVRKDLRAKGVTNVEVIAADKELTLGACLNLGVDASDGKYVAKVDDDNFYGRHYLTDLLDCFTHSGAGIVGKWAHYTWLRSSGAVVLRFPYAEHRFEKLVQGGTIILDREVVTDLRFGDLPRAVDTDILTRAKEAGVKTWSGDRFNFVSVRGVDRHAHTWPIADTALMNRAGHVAFFGDPREHVEV